MCYANALTLVGPSAPTTTIQIELDAADENICSTRPYLTTSIGVSGCPLATLHIQFKPPQWLNGERRDSNSIPVEL